MGGAGRRAHGKRAMRDYRNVLVEASGGVLTLTLHRPEVLNAVDGDTWLEIGRVVQAADADPAVRAIVITGSGDRAFCAGADLRWLERQSALSVQETPGPGVCDTIAGVGTPVIAALNGYTFGGGLELAMACDLRVASERATLGQLEINHGIIPGAGGTQRLPRLVGVAKAKELTFTGDVIDAREALAIGLVNRVVAHDRLLPAALELAGRITEKAPQAVRMAKAAIELGMATDLRAGLAFERVAQAILFATRDKDEGMAAFREKRKPRFEGH